MSSLRCRLHGWVAVLFAIALPGCKGAAKILDGLADSGTSSNGSDPSGSEGAPAPEGEPVVAEAQEYPGGLVADETFLYWTTTRPGRGTVYRARLDGSDVTAISENVASLEALAIDAKHVFFLDGSRLMRVPKGGGETRALFDAKTVGPPTGIGYSMTIGSFFVDPSADGNVFVATRELTTNRGKRETRSWRMSSLAKAGGTPTTATDSAAGDVVGLDATHVFLSTTQNDLIRMPRTLAGRSEKVAEFGILDHGTCRSSSGGRLCCKTANAFRCLDADGKSLANTPCDAKKLGLTDLVAVDRDDAFFTQTQTEPRRLLRCDLRSGKITSAMRLAGKNDVMSAFVRNGHVYALVFREPSGVIAKARVSDR